MSVILVPDYVVIGNDPDYSDRVDILGTCIADSFSALPDPDFFDGFHLVNGFKGITTDNGSEYLIDSSGTWNKVNKSPYADVYTKDEVNTITDAISANVSNLQIAVDNLQVSNDNQSLYIYALIGRSALNLIDSSVWNGQTPGGSGYICQDLPISLPAGSYVWKMKRDGNTSTSFVLKAADNTELYRVNRGAGVNDITQLFTITADAAKVSIYVGYNIAYSDNMIFENLTV